VYAKRKSTGYHEQPMPSPADTATDVDAWLARLAELWRRERHAHEQRFAEDIQTRSLTERIKSGVSLRRLVIDEHDATAGGRTLLWLISRKPADVLHFRLQPGDPVRLTAESLEKPIRATLSRRQHTSLAAGERIAVIVDETLPETLDGSAAGDVELQLDPDSPGATFDRGDAAITRFRSLPRADERIPLRDVLMGQRPPALATMTPAPLTAPLDRALDQRQRDAVAAALAAPDIALIHGPPGTGKTRTLVEVIGQMVARGQRVLATAASNTAVDNLAERLIAAGVDTIRLGHPARVAPAVEARTLDVLLRGHPDTITARRWLEQARKVVYAAHRRPRVLASHAERRATLRAALAEAQALRRDARRLLADLPAGLLSRTAVVCATAAGADLAILGDQRFDCVVLDEATQAPDPLALVALSRAPRAVLAGDPHQLPPTVLDLEADRAGLGTTFFERLIERAPAAGRLLRVQHRMHADIMEFPSQSKYHGLLEPAPAVAGHRVEDLGAAADPLRPGAFVFVDSAGKGWLEERGEGDASTRNPGQAGRVAAEIRRLAGRGVAPADMAVIAPYRAQVRLLRDELADLVAAGLEIATVDAFQGREREVVIVDLVRCNDESDIGFLSDTRRMNVALTRARRFLLVVGDSATIAAHPYYAAFVAHAESTGAWLSAWTDDAPPFEP
jgi:ATP-dependent RNA/DNA helicase IGHMBP2